MSQAPYRIPYASPGSVNSKFDGLCAINAYAGTVDPISVKEGVAVITSVGVNATTLALPVAGLPSVGGDDGRILIVKCGSAHAHTVTTPANGINGADDTITFTASVLNYITLVACGGVWYTLGSVGVTLTEV